MVGLSLHNQVMLEHFAGEAKKWRGDRWTYRPKRCEYNYKDEDNSPKIPNDKNLRNSNN